MLLKPRIALICHRDDVFNHDFVGRWLASFAEIAGIVEIEERRGVMWRRLRAEVRRVGIARLFDVLAYRVYYRLALAADDSAWERAAISRAAESWKAPDPATPVLRTRDPNDETVRAFLERVAPDLAVARCKWLLKRAIYSTPRLGTFALHPGICPQYRNAHGCFWALASDDPGNAGMTLLAIDDGIDTGPVYGYYRYPFDALRESHVRIQHRVFLENAAAIRDRLLEICAGRAGPLRVANVPSRNWGQPWLSAYLHYRRRLRDNA
jgi:folate-dependent phosphoribosylglycinamide formyltransferase PurN